MAIDLELQQPNQRGVLAGPPSKAIEQLHQFLIRMTSEGAGKTFEGAEKASRLRKD